MEAVRSVMDKLRDHGAHGMEAAVCTGEAHLKDVAKVTYVYCAKAVSVLQMYGREHSYLAAATVAQAGAVLILDPGGIVAYPLQWIGFGPAGLIAGSWAAAFQSLFYGGWTAAGSTFAYLQALAMTV